ncbi:MAG: exo-alpha-sialidase [Clostridia bacterium]|nr:exo-alpha-sialidase [Clostridia bacterium]
MTILPRPAGGRNRKEPFLPGNGGSMNFRIPCLWAGDDGTLYAAMDVRWDAEADGGGLAVAFSRSEDDGETWDYSFPAFFGDSGKRHDGAAATLMDPLLAVSGKTVFLLFDLFPHGRALLAGEGGAEEKLAPGRGLDREGNLLLRARGEEAYRFRLKDGKILDETGQEAAGYAAGSWFSLAGGGEESGFFFRGAAFEAYPTSYLCLLVSRDGGRNWEEPRLLPGKRDEEAFLGTAPGRGLITGKGEILFPVYNGSEASFLFSRDGGESFKRVPGVPGTESQLLELPSGAIRMFVRNPSGFLTYADYRPEGRTYRPGKPVRTGFALCSNCMSSAILLPGKDGEPRIALAAPSGQGLWNGRFGGKLRIFRPEKDGTMSLLREIPLGGKDDFFAYSCLAPLPGGRVAVLYEDSAISYLGKEQGIGLSRAIFRILDPWEGEA